MGGGKVQNIGEGGGGADSEYWGAKGAGANFSLTAN